VTDKQTFILISPKVRANAAQALAAAPADYVVTLAPRTRSTDQNAMFHAICDDIAKSGQTWAGKKRSAAEWKVLLISGHAIATNEGAEVIPGLEGEYINIRESSALMSVKRAKSLIDYTLAYCDMNGIELPETKRGGHFDEIAA
jgi:hypothetical protein